MVIACAGVVEPTMMLPRFSDVGEAKITWGAVTVTVTVGDAALLLEESEANALILCVPRETALVSQLML